MRHITTSLVALTLLLSACNEEKTTKKNDPTPKEQLVQQEQKEIPQDTMVPELAKTGQTLFMACAGCHGGHAQKSALNQSHIIKGWSVEKITHALKGYQAGTYGGSMKGLMHGQVSVLSDKDINMLAHYISKL